MPRRAGVAAVAVLAAVLPFEFSTVVLSIAGHNVRSVHFVALIALFVLIIDVLAATRPNGRPSSDHRWLFVGLAAVAWFLLLSTVFADGFVVQATMSARRLLTGIAIAALMLWRGVSAEEQRIIASGFAGGSAMAAGLGLAHVASIDMGLESVVWGQTNLFGDIERLSVPFGHPNVAATHLTTGLLLGLGLAATSTKPWRAVWFAASLLSAIALTFTLSRGPVVAALIGCAALAMLAQRQRRRDLGTAAFACTIIIVGIVAVQPTWHLRLRDPEPAHWYAVSIVVNSDDAGVRSLRVSNDSQVSWDGSPNEFIEIRSVSPEGTVAADLLDLPPLDPGETTVVVVGQDLSVAPNATIDVWRPGRGRFNRQVGAAPVTLSGAPAVEESLDASVGIAPRRELWSAAWTLARERPLSGVGPGNFRLNYQEVIGRPAPATSHAHSIVFEPIASWGFPAALLFWSILAASLVTGLRRASSDLALPLLAALVAVVVSGALDWVVASASGGLALWLLIGLINQRDPLNAS